MHRATPREPWAQPPVAPAPRRVTAATFLRSAVAAGGAVAGVAAAIPLGALLTAFLFDTVGTAIVDEIMSDGVAEGLSGIEAFFGGLMLAIAAIMIAIMVVLALVAPVFVVLPMLGAGVALRVARAGLIMRSLWLSLAALALLVAAAAAVLSAFDADGKWWMWVVVVAAASLVGRLAVELWEPQRAATRSPVAFTRVWWRLLIVWICLLVAALVTGTTLFITVV
ncbi:MAG: hypothetical protein GEV07_26415 [Streptosporangiales bacterium]|nr:hypothetical protein [Streptosporangiales bacterium]